MMKKIFGMAAVSALAFGLFACSDGEDGINGKNGADGADGVSCAVKALKDSSGFKVLCDGDSVGVLKNGADGKDGKKGADGKNGADGEDGNDGADAKAVNGKDGAKGADGTGCSAKENKEKNGYDIVCDGKTVGTVTNGKSGTATNGDDGEPCTLEEGEDGSVTVSCDGKSATLFNHTCGTVGYDPATHFCYKGTTSNPRIGVRCKYRDTDTDPEANHLSATYDPLTYFCDEADTLRKLCEVKKDDGTTEKVPFVYGTHYCDVEQKKVVAYIPCAPGSKEKRKENQYCYTTKGVEGILVEDLPWCGNSANGKRQYNPRLKACLAKSSGSDIPSKVGDRLICGDAAAQKDTLNIDIRYNKDINDDGRGELCDDRDWKIYKITKVNQQVWMAQNLNYDYNLPSAGNATVAGLESSSACRPDDPTCETYGRFYLWSAAIDSTGLANLAPENGGRVCGRGNYCEFDDDVKGACPTGWHLPSKGEFSTLIDFVGSSNGNDLLTTGSDKYGFSFVPNSGCLVETTEDNKLVPVQCSADDMQYIGLWTATGAGATEGNYYNFHISPSSSLSLGAGNLSLMANVRCIKD